jgi:hypothetical protein
MITTGSGNLQSPENERSDERGRHIGERAATEHDVFIQQLHQDKRRSDLGVAIVIIRPKVEADN